MSRADFVRQRSICLTQTNPLARLEELCTQGGYLYRWNYDRFKNGFFMELELSYKYTNQQQTRSRILTRRAHFVPTKDLTFAQSQVAALMLQEVGLGVVEEEEDPEEEAMSEELHHLAQTSMRIMNQMISGTTLNEVSPSVAKFVQESSNGKSWADIVEEEAQLGESGTLPLPHLAMP